MGKVKKILIVEDDKQIRESLTELLEMEGHNVAQACNGQIALQILIAQPNFDIIFLDLMMPVMDGFTFKSEQEKIIEISKIPVIILSADGHIEEKKIKIGAKNYIRKPFELEEILKTIETLETIEPTELHAVPN